ncbi:MAG TPA: hypothetical protein VKE22_13370 [Haliangiales bacterium]|nr:hypothetical protein [Haliangiales bacterium]
MPRYLGWPDEAAALVERGVRRHGGWEAWRSLRRVSFRPIGLGGFLPWAKGHPRTFPLPPEVETFPHERRTVFRRYPDDAHEGVFDAGDVRLVGATTVESRDHRSTFRGLAKLRRWRPIDGLYFFGYALWHYHALPFVLADARFVRLRRNAVTVDFPPDVPTHSTRQTFHFDGEGLLRRHDYTAEVVGAWARGAHLWDDFVAVDGFAFATRRRVQPRVLGRALPLTVLRAEIRDFAVG